MTASYRVLLVEDDRILRRAAEAMLGDAGFAVTTAADGEAGIRLVREMRPDIVLLDLLMPRRSGVDVLQEMKGNPETARIPVIILSNSSREDFKAKALALGATEYHLKADLTLTQLVARVSAILGGDGNPGRSVDLADLGERLGGDPRLIADVIAGYREDIPLRMARLRRAVAAGDAHEIEHAAHSVQGALLLVGARAAAEVARRIEVLARDPRLATLDIRLEGLEAAVGEVGQALDAAFPGNSR